MAKRFVEVFRDLNADIAKHIRAKSGGMSLLELAISTNLDNAIGNMNILLGTLERCDVLYIFDEHNEFYRQSKQGKSALDENNQFLEGFTRWTGPTRGVSNLSIVRSLHVGIVI